MPTIFNDRLGVSLYDAQHATGEKQPIGSRVIESVVKALLQFKKTCQDYGVPDERVRVVATEATRVAVNSEAFRNTLESATGWKVELLAKEEEGKLGAMGIASGFSNLSGLVLDMGGGSVQMTWMIFEDGEFQMSPQGAVSMPYGAGPLTDSLETSPEHGATQIAQEVTDAFEQALRRLEVPPTLNDGGWKLYLSGGGFRGWGYLLMAKHALKPYPVPIINGFNVLGTALKPDPMWTFNEPRNWYSKFGISKRRASQLPAIALLVNALTKAIGPISTVYFAQGGLREGLLFSTLPTSIRSTHPIIAATAPFVLYPTIYLADILEDGLPPFHTALFSFVDRTFLDALGNLLQVHADYPKDIQAASALRSTTTGVLGNAHGLSHDERVLMGLTLCERWGGDLPPGDEKFYGELKQLVGRKKAWWAKYVGGLARAVGNTYPRSGAQPEPQEPQRLRFRAEWNLKGTEECLYVTLSSRPSAAVSEWVKDLKKLENKKSFVGIRVEPKFEEL